MEDISIIYDQLKKEVESSTLQELVDRNMYIRLAEILNELKGKGYEGLDANVREMLVEMLTDIARLMLTIRIEKVKSCKDIHDIDYSMLTEEELYIALEERELRYKHELVLSSIINGRSKVLEALRERIRGMLLVVRFLKHVDAFIAKDGRKYGPFNAEDVAVIPLIDALEFIKQGVAIELPILDM